MYDFLIINITCFDHWSKFIKLIFILIKFQGMYNQVGKRKDTIMPKYYD